MAYWVLAPNIQTLRSNLREAFPNRLTTSDGTIGDPAHAAGVSGHNPDDTPGVRAESSDADSVPEVRACDADKDLDGPSTPRSRMQAVVDAIRRNPEDRSRLIYMIYDGYIYSENSVDPNTGVWLKRVYNGTNKHREHAHFSGKASRDNDTRPFKSVLAFKPKPPPPPQAEPEPLRMSLATRRLLSI
jgi:hypothetical protein